MDAATAHGLAAESSYASEHSTRWRTARRVIRSGCASADRVSGNRQARLMLAVSAYRLEILGPNGTHDLAHKWDMDVADQFSQCGAFIKEFGAIAVGMREPAGMIKQVMDPDLFCYVRIGCAEPRNVTLCSAL